MQRHRNASMDASLIKKLKLALGDLQSALEDAVDRAQAASRLADRIGGQISRVVGGQLEGYTIGHLESFIENENQAGSVASLLEFLKSEEVEEENE